ncbi:MAG: glycosyltransferase family 4 protein [Planctomycetaceae bacterium]|nr:glycosyltransferase family 4 protein [Planctomycetaceae bacterium]
MKAVLVQTTVGDYRQAFVNEVTQRLGESFDILCGKEYFYPSLKTGVVGPRVFVVAKNIFLFGRRGLLQLGVHRRAIQADVAVLEYNPRIINTWTVALLRKVLGRRTILWGHVHSRRGSDNWLRRFQRSLGTGLIVYTEEQKQILIDELRYRGEAFAAPNALYSQSEMCPLDSPDRRDFLYVGRLVPDKKPQLMVAAFAKAMPSLPADSRLLIVGDGPERPALERLIETLNLKDRVILFGHVSNYEKLKSFYATSIASLSPGYVGLSITQSLGFGIPMIYSRDEPHAPETVAAKENWNCLIFETDSAEDFAEKMLQISREKAAWIQRTAAISEDCRNKFSVERMASEFVKAIRGHE